MFPRSAGFLLHISSLPGPHGIGDLGKEAYKFIDFLVKSRISWWQMLPVGATDLGSPYQALSEFAGNPWLISLEELAGQGLLSEKDLLPEKEFSKDQVHFDQVAQFKSQALRKAFSTFQTGNFPNLKAGFETFKWEKRGWLEDFSLFLTLKAAHGGVAWTHWPKELRARNYDALGAARQTFAEEIQFHTFNQFHFSRQWESLKTTCKNRGIGLIGDLPIYPAHDSAEVWAHQDDFFLGEDGEPTVVAGVPPDYFSVTGQRWGNPLYRWNRLREKGFEWWIQRLRGGFSRFDAIRLDHFIGFSRYWEIPVHESTAVNGRWVQGPGEAFFDTVFQQLGGVKLIAEDLGLVTPEVRALRNRYGMPGMRVLQFAFGDEANTTNEHLPYNHSKNEAVFAGTHDNPPVLAWWRTIPPKEKAFVLQYLGKSNPKDISWDMMRLALGSVADLAVVTAQDVLALGIEGRMNAPGTIEGNWSWRIASPDALTDEIAERLAGLIGAFGRIPKFS